MNEYTQRKKAARFPPENREHGPVGRRWAGAICVLVCVCVHVCQEPAGEIV